MTAVSRGARLLAVLLASFGRPSSAAAAAAAAGTEERELASASSEAAGLVKQAAAAARAGMAREAWALFGTAWSLAPRSPVPPRGICRLALALGIDTTRQRAAARAACESALMLGGTPEDMRNRAASLVVGAVPPSMEDLVAASFAAEGAARMGPGQVWGSRARADLAVRLGDREMLNAAAADLERQAPGDEQTKQVAALAAPGASFGVWLGRSAVVLILLAGLARSLARGQWHRRRGGGVPLARSIVMTLVLLALPRSGRAAAAPIDDDHPEASVPNADEQLASPLAYADLVTELTTRAHAATVRGDQAAAARYWAAITKAFPDRAYGFAQLCESLEASGQREAAVAACRTAITRKEVTASDYTRFVKVLLAQEGPLSTGARRQIDVAIASLEAEPRAALIAELVRCDVAAHEHDARGLAACTAKLAAAAPDDPRTVAFQWALAFERGDRAAEDRLLALAHAKGVPPSVLARMQSAAGHKPIAGASGAARALLWGAGGVAATLILYLLAAAGKRALTGVRRRLASP